MHSIWQTDVTLPSFPPLDGDRHTDVLVIGGGLTGLLCAYFLQQAGIPCLLAEAGTICSGVTQNTTAKVTSQHGLRYDSLLRRFGVQRARLYLQANQAALAQFRKLSQQFPCDFVPEDSYVYARTGSKKLRQELQALDTLGWKAEWVSQLPLPFSVSGAVKFPNQARMHPLRFAAGIARRLPILEHTRVLELAPGQARTNHGTIFAKKIIVATHFPMLNKHGSYFLKLYQHRSYVLALSGAPALSGMYVDEDPHGLSLRMQGDLLLLGGGSHRTGKRGGGWAELSALARQYFPQAKVCAQWATQDCMSLDGVPYIGQYSANTPDLFVATGFQKWGMTSGMVAAMLLTDLIQGKSNPWEAVFSPSRSILHGQLLCNVAETACNFLRPTTPRCPHLGCALRWNPQEHSWDCPCHGSRFSSTGELLENPATGNLRRRPQSSR